MLNKGQLGRMLLERNTKRKKDKVLPEYRAGLRDTRQ